MLNVDVGIRHHRCDLCENLFGNIYHLRGEGTGIGSKGTRSRCGAQVHAVIQQMLQMITLSATTGITRHSVGEGECRNPIMMVRGRGGRREKSDREKRGTYFCCYNEGGRRFLIRLCTKNIRGRSTEIECDEKYSMGWEPTQCYTSKYALSFRLRNPTVPSRISTF